MKLLLIIPILLGALAVGCGDESSNSSDGESGLLGLVPIEVVEVADHLYIMCGMPRYGSGGVSIIHAHHCPCLASEVEIK